MTRGTDGSTILMPLVAPECCLSNCEAPQAPKPRVAPTNDCSEAYCDSRVLSHHFARRRRRRSFAWHLETTVLRPNVTPECCTIVLRGAVGAEALRGTHKRLFRGLL